MVEKKRAIVIVADTVTEEETDYKWRVINSVLRGEIKPTGAELDFYCDRCKKAFPGDAKAWLEHQNKEHGGPRYVPPGPGGINL